MSNETNRHVAGAALKTALCTGLAFALFIVQPVFFPLTFLSVIMLFAAPVAYRAYRGPKRRASPVPDPVAADAPGLTHPVTA